MRIDLRPDLAALEDLSAAIESYADAQGISAGDAMRLNLVLDELFTNAVDYGCQPEGSFITVDLTREEGQTLVRMEDSGIAFDPTDIPPPDLEASLEERPIGGLGLHFLMTFMTDLSYRNENNRNCVTFRQIDRAPEQGE